MYLGVDWYPEQWGMEHVDEDLQGIVDLGCNIIRLADFGWDVLEPKEFFYNFSFFDQVIAKAKAAGLKVLMCVPTATMPSWLALRYPRIMAEDENHQKRVYGGRRAYCYNSPEYRHKAKALAEAMIRHYKNEDAIVAWQIDNEIGHEGSDMCYCGQCRKEFTAFLRRHYASIQELNQCWGTSFWSQTYSRFEDVPLPLPALTAQNPALRLDWERFRSSSINGFLKMLYEAIKNIAPQAVVLHDFSGGLWDKHFDPFEAASRLDETAYNNYPVWGGQRKPQSPAEVSFALDTARGLKGRNFWITEQIMGAQGHDIIGCAPLPDQAVVWSWQAVAHGCSALLFFRYRGFNRGAEQYCFGLLDADNQKRRRYREAQNFFTQVKPWADILQGPIENKTALVFDYDSAAAWRIQPQSDAMNYQRESFVLYQQLYRRNVGVDIINSKTALGKYKLVIVAAMIVMDDGYKQRLKEYVKNGGLLILTFRSGWKDKNNAIPFGCRQPAGLDDLTGCVIDEQESLLTSQVRRVTAAGRLKKDGLGSIFCEMLKPVGAETLLKWDDCPFGDYAAATVNHYWAGKCYYLGSSFDEVILDDLFDDIAKELGYTNKHKSDDNETVIRRSEKGATVINLDYTANKVTVSNE